MKGKDKLYRRRRERGNGLKEGKNICNEKGEKEI